MLNAQPTTKNELLESIRKSKVQSFVTRDSITKQDVQSVTKELQSFIGNGSKNVSVIFLKES
jgi:hypothetical protein